MVVVSVVHIAKGQLIGPYFLDGRNVPIITAFLFHDGGDEDRQRLRANANQSFIGSYVLGMGFTIDDSDKKGVANPISLMHELLERSSRNSERIYRYIGADEVNDRTALKTGLFLIANCPLLGWGMRGIEDAGQPGFFDSDERLTALSAAGDLLQRLAKVVDFEVFRDDLEAALSRSDRSKGGWPPYDPVLMFKVLVLQTLYTLSDDQTEYQLKDRLSFMRFVDRRYRITHAAAYDGGQLGAVLDPDNTASEVWADTAYRSAANLALLDRRGLKPQFQRKKPRGKKMPAHIACGNATRARVRSRVEHVFAAQKCRLGLLVRTIGMVRARVKIGLANLAYNFTRLAWLRARTAPA